MSDRVTHLIAWNAQPSLGHKCQVCSPHHRKLVAPDLSLTPGAYLSVNCPREQRQSKHAVSVAGQGAVADRMRMWTGLQL